MAAAAPQPTSTRRSLRRTRNVRPNREASGRADLRVAGLQPDRGADAVRHAWSAPPRSGCRSATCARRTARSPRSGRPPGAGHQRRRPMPSRPSTRPPTAGTSDRAERIEFDHRAQPLVGADTEQQLVDELGGLGHQPDHDAGPGADESRQHDQPDFVGANQRAQRLRRVQDRLAQVAAMAVGACAMRCLCGGHTPPRVRDDRRARES